MEQPLAVVGSRTQLLAGSVMQFDDGVPSTMLVTMGCT